MLLQIPHIQRQAELVDATELILLERVANADKHPITECTLVACTPPASRTLILLIRTSGEMRISNFLLCRSLFRDLRHGPPLGRFRRKDLSRPIVEFQRRNRRMAALNTIFEIVSALVLCRWSSPLSLMPPRAAPDGAVEFAGDLCLYEYFTWSADGGGRSAVFGFPAFWS